MRFNAATTAASTKPNRAKLSVAVVLFVVWAGSALGVVAGLARNGCGAMPPIARAASNVAPGWRIEHWLPKDHALTPLLAEQLMRRGARAGWDDRVWTDGRLGEITAGLRAAGWQVAETTERRRSEPLLDIIDPEGRVAGQAGYQAAEVEAASEMFDDAVLAAVAQGRRAPRYVPAACGFSTPQPSRREAPRYLSL